MIKHKTILITGGSSGIGLAAVNLFLRNDNKVIVIDKIRIKKKDKNLFFYKFDLTKIKYIKTIVKKISLKFNKIDVLILNAGICPFEKFLKIDQNLFDLVVNVNQKSAFLLGIVEKIWVLIVLNCSKWAYFGSKRRYLGSRFSG